MYKLKYIYELSYTVQVKIKEIKGVLVLAFLFLEKTTFLTKKNYFSHIWTNLLKIIRSSKVEVMVQ